MARFAEDPFSRIVSVAWPAASATGFVASINGSTTPKAPGIGPIDVATNGDNAGHVAWNIVIFLNPVPASPLLHALGLTSGQEDDWGAVPESATGLYTSGGTTIDPCEQAGVIAYRYEISSQQRLELFGLHPHTGCYSTGGAVPAIPGWIAIEPVELTP